MWSAEVRLSMYAFDILGVDRTAQPVYKTNQRGHQDTVSQGKKRASVNNGVNPSDIQIKT